MCAYVLRTSSLNNKHSCQLFKLGSRDKTTPTLTTPLIRANMSCEVLATIFSSLALLSLSISMGCVSIMYIFEAMLLNYGCDVLLFSLFYNCMSRS